MTNSLPEKIVHQAAKRTASRNLQSTAGAADPNPKMIPGRHNQAKTGEWQQASPFGPVDARRTV